MIVDGRIESVRAVGNLSALQAKLDERRCRAGVAGGGERGGRGARGDHRHRAHALGDPRPG